MGKSKQKKSKQPTADDDYNVNNFYELDNVKKYSINYHNPRYNYEKMPLKHPMRMVICGASGSGKSNLLLNIIKLMDRTFEKMIIFTQNKEE
jgi:ABC-type lipoprotein export system ATPase subunit